MNPESSLLKFCQQKFLFSEIMSLNNWLNRQNDTPNATGTQFDYW